MEKVIQFLKNTKIVSRIMGILWLILGAAGAGFESSDYVITYPVMAIFFLLPVVIVELKTNPVLKQNTEENKRYSSKPWKTTLLLSIFLGHLGAHRFFSGKIASGVVYLLTMGCFGIGWLTDVILLLTDGFTDKYGATISRKANSENIVPFEGTEPNSENGSDEKYISKSRIVAIACSVMACIGILILATGSSEENEALLPTLMFAIVALSCWCISFTAPKTKAEAAERKQQKKDLKAYEKRMRPYNGVHLSEQQIFRLENKIALPNIDTPVFLGADEIAVYHSIATLQETKHRVVGRTGGYSGGSVRIAKGFSIRTGSSTSRPVYGDVSTHYDGEMVLTNKRLVFLNAQKGFEVAYSTMTAATAYTDGLAIQNRNHTYTLLLPNVNLAVIAFDAVRTGEIPIENTATYDTEDYIEDGFDNDEWYAPEGEDVTMVDGMEGHEFEYFCADLLRKNGFLDVRVTRGSGDQGVDVLATKGGIKYAIQCKNYASPLSNTPVQEVSAGKIFYNCHVGVVLTNSTFTPGAISLANATGVLLWDRSVLADLMKTEPSSDSTSVGISITPPQASTAHLTPRPQNAHATPPLSKNHPSTSETPAQKKSVRIDNIDIEIDVQSLSRYNIVLDNFGIEMDEDEDEDRIELLFDVISKGGRGIPCSIDIVCNLYAGNRKIMTERETVYNESFRGRDSLCVYFDKKRVCKTATKIELFCQKW